MEYNLAAIRKLIDRSLTEDDFDNLLFDHFEYVDRNTRGQSRSAKTRKLIEYVDRNQLISDLLAHIQQINPSRYQEFESQIILPSNSNPDRSSPSQIPDSPSNSRQEKRHRRVQKIIKWLGWTGTGSGIAVTIGLFNIGQIQTAAILGGLTIAAIATAIPPSLFPAWLTKF